MILIKTYIEQLPPALEESASLDGAGYLTCFFKIVLPLCKPIIATVVVFVAVGQWNSWFDNHIYTRANENLTTLQYLLYNYLNEAQRLAEQLKNASSGADMPLRYNNDKQKKPLFSRGLSVCRLLFNSFSKLKIDENYKEKRRLFY